MANYDTNFLNLTFCLAKSDIFIILFLLFIFFFGGGGLFGFFDFLIAMVQMYQKVSHISSHNATLPGLYIDIYPPTMAQIIYVRITLKDDFVFDG